MKLGGFGDLPLLPPLLGLAAALDERASLFG
jgi:hypothetical protein